MNQWGYIIYNRRTTKQVAYSRNAPDAKLELLNKIKAGDLPGTMDDYGITDSRDYWANVEKMVYAYKPDGTRVRVSINSVDEFENSR